MELLYFAQILWKRKLPILLLSIIAGIVTFMLATEKTVRYKSTAKIATGIIGYIEHTEEGNLFVQEFEITNRFNNLMEMMKSRNSINMLLSHLVLHDLTQPNPFHDLKEVKNSYTAEQLNSMATALQNSIDLTKQASPAADTLWLHYERDFKTIAKLLKYDAETLINDLKVERITNTDYLKLDFISDNPDLSSYALNSFGNSFIQYYSTIVNRSTNESIALLSQMVATKRAELDGKMDGLKQFKLSNEVADLDQQTKTTLNQISSLEVAREEAKKKIPAYEKSLRTFNDYTTENQQSFSQIQNNNQRIRELRDRISQLNNEFITTGNPNIKKQIDGLRNQLDQEIRATANESVNGKMPSSKDLATKGTDLWERKINTEVELELAKQSVQSVDKEIDRLKGQISHYVEKEANISSIDREIAMLSEEYLSLSEKLNAAEMSAKSSHRNNSLQVIESARPPDKPEASQRTILAGFAGATTFTLCMLFVLLLAYIDNSLTTTAQYERMIKGVPLLQHINKIDVSRFDIETIFKSATNDKGYEAYKQFLRNLRFDIESTNAKNWLITSTQAKQGKTLTLVGLAYALFLNNKRVLIIDTNFKNNTLSQLPFTTTTDNSTRIRTIIKNLGMQTAFATAGNLFENNSAVVDIVASRSSNLSASEILAGKDFKSFIAQLQPQYDYIFMEGPALNDTTDTKELVKYADKLIAVFSANTKLTANDQASLEYMRTINGKLKGAVLNQIELKNI